MSNKSGILYIVAHNKLGIYHNTLGIYCDNKLLGTCFTSSIKLICLLWVSKLGIYYDSQESRCRL